MKAVNHVESIALDEVLLVPVLVMLEPLHAIVVVGIGSIAGSVALRRAPLKLIFNLAQMVVATTVAIWVVWALGIQLSSSPGFHDAVLGMLGALVITTMTALLVRQHGCLRDRCSASCHFSSIFDPVPAWAGAVTLGGVAAISVGTAPLSAILILGLIVFVARAYSLSVSELSARRQAERLQQATASLRSHTDPEMVKQDLLRAAHELSGRRNRNRR